MSFIQDAEAHPEAHPQPPTKPRAMHVRKRLPLSPRLRYALLAFLSATAAYFLLGLAPTQLSEPAVAPSRPGYLHLLVPTRDYDSASGTPSASALCNTLHSAAVLGYSTPTPIHWSLPSRDAAPTGRRIAGILRYLRMLSENAFADDIAVVVDEGAVFQLRPEVLLGRFLQGNGREDGGLRGWLGGDVVVREGVRRRVVFAAARGGGRGLGLNGRMVVGSVADLRGVFERAWEFLLIREEEEEKKKKGRLGSSSVINSTGSDNAEAESDILSHIFAEQNVQREFLRRHYQSPVQRLRESTGGFLGRYSGANDGKQYTETTKTLLDPSAKDLARYYPNAPFEFGIGIDSADELWAVEGEVELRTFGAQAGDGSGGTTSLIGDGEESWDAEETTANGALPEDIAVSAPPFWAPHIAFPTPGSEAQTDTDAVPSSPLQSWAETPLFTSTTTSRVPVVVFGESDAATVFNQSYFSPYVRALLASAAAAPRQRVATTQMDGVGKGWWSVVAKDRRDGGELGVLSDEWRWKGLHEVCRTE